MALRMTPRRLLIGVVAAVAALAIISLPFFLNRDEAGPPSIAAAQTPSPAEERAAAEAEAEPRRHVLPPRHGIYLGVSNYSLASGESTIDELEPHARRPPADRELVPAVAERRAALPHGLGPARLPPGSRADGHLGAVVGPPG